MSRSERNGCIVLIGLIILMIVYNYASPYLFTSKTIDYSHLDKEVEEWLASNKNLSEDEFSPVYSELASTKTEITPRQFFKFNPNHTSIEEFEKLGFTKKQAQTVKKYLDKGGSFKTKKDFSKMYFLSEEYYAELRPFIDLPESLEYEKKYDEYKNDAPNSYSEKNKEKSNYKPFDYSNLKVEINSADTIELKKINGIGSFTAKKIVQFREHLGGFTSIDQLIEVYPLNMEKLDSMRPNLIVDTGLMKKININEVQAEQLSKHPYLSSAQAKSIIAYRTMHGNFKQVEDIKKSVLIDQKTFEKVKDYLRVN